MKHFFYTISILVLLFGYSQQAHGQIFRRIKDKVEDKVVNKVDDAIDNATNPSEKDTDNNSNNEYQNNSPEAEKKGTSSSQPTSSSNNVTLTSYKNYDFVPGDKIMLVSNFSNRRNAALPSKFGLLQGTAEIQTYQGEKVLELERGSNIALVPLMKSKNYLPDQFTLEFDLLIPKIDNGYKTFSVFFFKSNTTKEDIKAPLHKEKHFQFKIDVADKGYIDFGESISNKKPRPALSKSLRKPGVWHHIALYVHNNVGKAYIDQYRVAATNMLPTGMVKMAIKTDGDLEYLIKNIRLAKGGSDVYQKIVSDGKYVTHGIHFASGKSEILPESMGTINEMFSVLKKHNDLQLEIDGYTDSDGSEQLNAKLSQARATAVKKKLVAMGIDTSRLTTKGFGEDNPIDTNATPEGKANNRRVEFVKQ